MNTKNKKLRLLVTTKCPNKRPLCCNNQFDFSKIPVVDRYDYDEISITGGEPLMSHLISSQTYDIVSRIRRSNLSRGIKTTFYLYTAHFDIDDFERAMMFFDGIVLTPHKSKDVEDFIKLNETLLRLVENGVLLHCSLRLNLFADMKALLPKDIDLSLWKVKNMEWIENCPVPEGEDFRRIANLF